MIPQRMQRGGRLSRATAATIEALLTGGSTAADVRPNPTFTRPPVTSVVSAFAQFEGHQQPHQGHDSNDLHLA